MAYTPTVWETGDVITAEKLNKAEQGIADAVEFFDFSVEYMSGGEVEFVPSITYEQFSANMAAGKEPRGIIMGDRLIYLGSPTSGVSKFMSVYVGPEAATTEYFYWDATGFGPIRFAGGV